MNNLRSIRQTRVRQLRLGWLVRFACLTGCVAAALWTSQVARAAGAPDLELILLRVIKNAAQDQETERLFKTRYAFVRTKVTETRDGDGELKKRTVQRIENQPGAAPPGEDAENREGAADPKAEQRGYERRDFEIKPELLKRFRFTLVGTDQWNDRPVWVIDFVPASDDLPAHSIKERFINKTTGRLWIDQAEEVLAKATFRLTEPVNVAGGLVGAVKKCEVETQRQRTQDGLWYPRRLVWHLEGRRLFWSKTIDHRDEVTEVQPAATAYAAPAPADGAE